MTANTYIYPSTHVKNLGVYIDRYMLFDAHIGELSKKSMVILMLVSRISGSFDKSTRIIVVQSLVLSLSQIKHYFLVRKDYKIMKLK